jgi:hypothetical protein
MRNFYPPAILFVASVDVAVGSGRTADGAGVADRPAVRGADKTGSPITTSASVDNQGYPAYGQTE